MRFNLCLSAFFLTLLACSSGKDMPALYKGDQLHFGQGGGFTGEVTYYVLLDDGRLFQRSDTTYTQMPSFQKSFTSQMFSNYHQLGLQSIDHNHPGNLYYFVEHHSRKGDVHRMTWGKPDQPAPANLVAFYNLLYKSTKSK